MSSPSLRVCVIGAGAAGLVALRHLTAQPGKYTATAYEQTASLGGTWVYTDDTGNDQYGLPIHSSMYKYMKTNLPKEVMAFPDLPFPKELPSFMTHKQVCGYLEDYTQHYDLRKHIQFLHQVVRVSHTDSPAAGSSHWDVQVQRVGDVNAPVEHLTYDAVMVCNGHYSVPLIPSLPGLSEFGGRVIHSHVYRHPEDFTDARVLVIGGGASGTDISIDLAGYAQHVTLLHRRPKPFESILPSNVSQVNIGIEKFTNNSVILSDKTELSITDVMLCTGYRYSFPFLDKTCKLENDEERLTPLYKHLLHIDHPTLSFIGVPKTICPFPQFHCQVLFTLAALEGTMQLPSKEEMYAEQEKDLTWRMSDLGMPLRHAHMLGTLQWDYNDELAKLAGFDPVPRVVQKLYDFVHDYRVKELPYYKKREFRLIDNENFKEIENVAKV